MASKEGRGRPGALPYLRKILTLIAGLTQDGDRIDPSDVAGRLQIPLAEARRLVDDLTSLSLPDDSRLALVMDQEELGVVELNENSRIKGKQLRLTKTEIYALKEALRRAGIQQDDPLNLLLKEFAQDSKDILEAERLLSSSSTLPDKQLMRASVEACVRKRLLRFLYQGASDTCAHERIVEPVSFRETDGHWYIEAFDLDREQMRRFRLDRMKEAQVCDESFEHRQTPHQSSESGPHMVEFNFFDEGLIELFDWAELEIIERSPEGVRVKLPDYKGSWLPAHLAGCGSKIRYSDESLQLRTQEHATQLLRRANRLSSRQVLPQEQTRKNK